MSTPSEKNESVAAKLPEPVPKAEPREQGNRSTQTGPKVAKSDSQITSGEPNMTAEGSGPAENKDSLQTAQSPAISMPNPPSNNPPMIHGKLSLRVAPAGASVVMQDQEGDIVHEYQSSGDLQLTELKPGDYRLVVRRQGYQEHTESLRVDSEQEVFRELVLEKKALAAAQPLKGTTIVGGYRMELLGIGLLDGMESHTDFKPDFKNQNGQGTSFGTFTTNNFGNSQTFNNRKGTIEAGGGFAGAGGGTYATSGISANCGIAIQIEADKGKAKGKRELVELSPKVKFTNTDGSVNESEDTRPLRISYPQFEKQFPGAYAAYIYRPSGTEPAIKTIEGELLLTPGRKLEAVFTDSKPQKKKVDGEIFQLHKLESTEQGCLVQLTFPETTLMKKANNMFEKLDAFARSKVDFNVMLVGYDGSFYLPIGKSGNDGGFGNFQWFTFDGTTQKSMSQSQEPAMTTMNFRFKPLPPSTQITKIIAIMNETQGETKFLPFVLNVSED